MVALVFSTFILAFQKLCEVHYSNVQPVKKQSGTVVSPELDVMLAQDCVSCFSNPNAMLGDVHLVIN